jgi:hypothetical protein
MNSQYQIVVQWDDKAGDFDFLIEIEDALLGALSASHEVDGHDLGSGEANVFIISQDPMLALGEIKDALAGKLPMSDVRIAYRDIQGDVFTVLWPEGLSEFNVA